MTTEHAVAAHVAAAERRLSAAGVPDARREAAVLLASSLGCSPLGVLVGHVPAPSPDALRRFDRLVARRADRVPQQLLLGRVGFHAIELETAPGVFVPRPETELLVDTVLQLRPGPRLVELGTGTGAIPIALLHASAATTVLSCDVSDAALGLARRNAERTGVSDRLALVASDGLEALVAHGPFDALVSNPPYIATDALADLAPEVRDHDPRAALDGGPDGLAVHRHLGAVAPRLLRAGGLVAVEIGFDQAASVPALFEAAGLERVEVIQDGAGHPRVVTAWTS